MILCFLKVIPMRFFSVVILLHAFKIESSLQKFCPGLFKSRWHGCFSIIHRQELSPEACGLWPDSLWSIAKLCSHLSSIQVPSVSHPTRFCQSVTWNTNPTPGPYSSLRVLLGTEASELPSQILLSQHLLLQWGFCKLGSHFAVPPCHSIWLPSFTPCSVTVQEENGQDLTATWAVASGQWQTTTLPGTSALGLRGWIQEERAPPALATAHSPCQEDICQPWCRRSLGVYDQDNLVMWIALRTTLKSKTRSQSPGIAGLTHRRARQDRQPRLPQALLTVLIHMPS